jgi:hypothetical protein
MLTGKEIADLGILQGFGQENVQQQGIDVRVAKIRRLNGLKGNMIRPGQKLRVR